MVNDLLERGHATGENRAGPTRRRRPVKLLAAVAGVAVLVPLGLQAIDALPQWGSPFEQQIVDRSPAALLVTLQDVAQYKAATGTFQVLVDVERDTPYVPSVISGERTTFFATGSVDALVDFSGLGPDRVAVSPDGRAVTVTLPAPVLSEPAVDSEQSRVVGRERGLAERLGGVFEDSPTGEQELYVLAGDKLAAAARESDLAARAEGSTRQMLTGLVGALGYEQVTVVFEADPA
jgi:hypothetical protein